MEFIGSKASCHPNGGVVVAFNAEKVGISVSLVFVENHDYRLCHSMVDTLDAPVAAGVVGACVEFFNT